MLNNIFEWRVLFYKTYKNSCFYAENWFKIWTVNQFAPIFAAVKRQKLFFRERIGQFYFPENQESVL